MRRSSGRVASVGLVLLVLISGMAAPVVRSGGVTVAEDDAAVPAPLLIAAAMESGQIDYGTSLVYRAYAVFGDERLPEEFVGAGAIEDTSLFTEARLNWDILPEGTRDLLTPFMVRPTDGRSIFAALPVADVGETGRGSSLVGSGDVECVDDWATLGHPDHPLKMWIQCTGDFAGDLEKMIAMIDEFWQAEIDLMGPPKPDAGGPDGGGDTRIDLYVVDLPTDILPRNGGIEAPFNDQIAALAIPDSPIDGRTASGYMIARRANLDEIAFPSYLAHEFFHVLQYAHNVLVTWGFSGTPLGDFEILRYTPYWFFEATPMWVEAHLFRDKLPEEVLAQTVHGYFLRHFQTDEPLFTSVARGSPMWSQMYASYIWFLFVEQEIGAEAIAQIWRNLESVEQDDFAGTLRAIDAVYPFAENFREFAVRNLNLDLQPGDPISPSYRDFDPSFPEGQRPPMVVGEGRSRLLEAQDGGEPARRVEDTIKPLSAHYYYLIPQDEVASVTLDVSGMTPAGTLDVDLIIRIAGKGWERRQLSTDEPTTLCRADPDDDVEAFYLVLSNHSMEIDGAIDGAVEISASRETCG